MYLKSIVRDFAKFKITFLFSLNRVFSFFPYIHVAHYSSTGSYKNAFGEKENDQAEKSQHICIIRDIK